MRTTPDRWWIVALITATIGTVLVPLLWYYPTSIWVQLLACFILFFAVVFYLHPRYRFWRRASWCFFIAGSSALVPTIEVVGRFEEYGLVRFSTESSPLITLFFLASGLVLSWIDSSQKVQVESSVENKSMNNRVNITNSPNVLNDFVVNGNMTVNQGISGDELVDVLNTQRDQDLRTQAASTEEQQNTLDDFVWNLVAEIKAARHELEYEKLVTHYSKLRKLFEQPGITWSKVLRTEVILLLAEEERTKISQARSEGRQVDLSQLQDFLKELQNDRT